MFELKSDVSGKLVELKKLVFQTGKDAEGAIRDNQGKTVLWLRFVTGLP